MEHTDELNPDQDLIVAHMRLAIGLDMYNQSCDEPFAFKSSMDDENGDPMVMTKLGNDYRPGFPRTAITVGRDEKGVYYRVDLTVGDGEAAKSERQVTRHDYEAITLSLTFLVSMGMENTVRGILDNLHVDAVQATEEQDRALFRQAGKPFPEKPKFH